MNSTSHILSLSVVVSKLAVVDVGADITCIDHQPRLCKCIIRNSTFMCHTA